MEGNDEGMLMYVQNVSSILAQEVRFKLLSVPEFWLRYSR